MLPRRHRLRRSAEIRYVRSHGRRWHHPLLLFFAAANEQDVSRFAISVSRRIGNAVVRNRCKRRVREAVRQHLCEIEPGWDCLFVVRGNLRFASFAEIEVAVRELLIQAKVLS